jgi:DNA-binding MarR family transcriptional regulator
VKRSRRLSPLRVLVALYALGGCGAVEDLSRVLGLKKPTVRSHLGALEKKGVVRREISESGRPVYCVEL